MMENLIVTNEIIVIITSILKTSKENKKKGKE